MASFWKSPKISPDLESVAEARFYGQVIAYSDVEFEMRKANNSEVDEYIAKALGPAQKMMKQIRATIRSVAPEAEEKMSYGIPFYEYKFPGYKGRLAYFGAYKKHISFYAVPRNMPPDLDKQLEKYKAAKATLQFPIGTEVPVDLLKQLVKLRKDEIDTR